MKKTFLLFALLLSSAILTAQENTFKTEEIAIDPTLIGTLYKPDAVKGKTNLIILIAGSGNTDRDGNQSGMQTNYLKLLAEGLAKKKYTVYSYDKRQIAQMKAGTVDEKSISFDNLISDTKSIIAYFKAKKQFNKIIIAGHSEGSLVGVVASQGNADAYISLAGPGRRLDEIIVEQITRQAPAMKEEIQKDFEILKKGETFELKNPMLAPIFRESLQPYMISILKYNPQDEIKKLQIPILLINGSKDIQVPAHDAELLHEANPKSELVIIENMNHVLKEIKGDNSENIKSYTDPALPVMPELVEKITTFLQKI